MSPDAKPDLEECHIDDFDIEIVPALLNPESEQRVVRKCDLHVVPILMVLYLLAFLDRINIGNAKLQGLEEDLGMVGNDYKIALFIFFIPYILCEIPCNLIIKRVAPSTWISSIMALWGIVTICQGLVHNWSGLVACRFFIGMLEAGFLPGCVYLISMYYKRYELQWRLTLFFSSSIVSGAISGLIAYGLAYMDGVRGYSSWQWIFILEGLATTVVALISKAFIVDWPETARFLGDPDRNILLQRLNADQGVYKMDRLDKNALVRILKDIKIYLGALMYMGVLTTGYAASFFTPTIIRDMGWTSLEAQIMSVPVYIAAAVLTLFTALASDRLEHRFLFALGGCLIATVGYIIFLIQIQVPTGAKYFALFAVTGGGFIAQPVFIGWLSNNMSGHYKQAVASAVQIGLGSCGGLVASNIFLASEAPLYQTGYGTCLGFIWMSLLSSIGFLLVLWCENRKREQGKRDYVLDFNRDEIDNLGDDHPHFRFTY